MSSVRKMVLVPFESEAMPQPVYHPSIVKNQSVPLPSNDQHSKIKRNLIKERAELKFMRILKVIAKLALINGYNEEGKIKGKNGYINNTSIADLISHAMSPGKLINGENDFIDLLREANVSPDLIANENIKQKLLNYNKPVFRQDIQPVIRTEQISPINPVVRPIKRKNTEEVEEVARKRNRLNGWSYSDDSE